MANTKKRIASDQLDFFHQLDDDPMGALEPVDLDMHHELLGAIIAAIKEARRKGRSREHIVERMNDVMPDLGNKITLRQLNAWTAVSKEFSEFPARYIPAFCWATGTDAPLRALANCLMLDLVDQRLQLATRLGENLLAQAELRRSSNAIKNKLERSK